MLSAAMVMLSGLAPQVVEAAERPAVIRVVGHGSVRTPPDLAVIGFEIRGEGRSSEEAVQALTERQTAIAAALAGAAEVRTGTLSVAAVRDPACTRDDDGDAPRLSTGTCAIRGYVASLGATARVTAVDEAGTLLATVSGLGATDPTLRAFLLSRPAAVEQAALVAAVQDARTQAQAIAAASRLTLGPVRRIEDQRAGRDVSGDIVVTAGRIKVGELATRVPVRLSPEPIETEASVVVEFAIGEGRS